MPRKKAAATKAGVEAWDGASDASDADLDEDEMDAAEQEAFTGGASNVMTVLDEARRRCTGACQVSSWGVRGGQRGLRLAAR